MGIRQLWKNRHLLTAFLELVREIVKTARNLAEIRDRLADGIQKGELDAPLEKFAAANTRAQDYIRTGR